MSASALELFRVGLGPSSSHTVGPMRAALLFVAELKADGVFDRVAGLTVDLYGSLAATGAGHGTPSAVILGLEGCDPEQITPDEARSRLAQCRRRGSVMLGGVRPVRFDDSAFSMRPLTVLGHANALRLTARDAVGRSLAESTYHSIGGGFVIRVGEPSAMASAPEPSLPLPFRTAAELLGLCARHGIGISEVMSRNEAARRGRPQTEIALLRLRDVMDASVASALTRTGELPGGLGVKRRAAQWHDRLLREDPGHEPAFWQERVALVALAVNEENASGGRVVTAPTNGAAGILPAVLYYAVHYAPGMADASREARDDVTIRFLLTAAAIGVLYKEQASISGAELGCQAEVGSASSMAAGALAEVLGGTPEQVENAAEIAMEHNLGLTCDPVAGLVQVPCIERNAIGAQKAISAAKMALWGDGSHRVSLDEVIRTMRSTGLDMDSKYKETSRGGLAVNVVEC